MHRLGEPAADQLRGHLEQCISDRHTQPCRAADLGGTFDCSGEVMPLHAQTRQYLKFIGVWFRFEFRP